MASPLPPSPSSLDAVVSDLFSLQRFRAMLSKNPKARYTIIATIAALVAALIERKRRAEKIDEVKRGIPHRRNSAVHLYNGTSIS
jgi:hypothetical protein